MGLGLSDAPAHWLVLEDPPGPADAAVVLAGDPDYERTATGAAIVRSGGARLLVLTGGQAGPGDSAGSLWEKAVAMGVPPAAIRSETVSHTTHESLLAVAPILARERVRAVVLVTSPYHQRRAFLVARKAWPGITIRNRPATPSSWSPRNWWGSERSRGIVLSEYGKLIYYALRGWL